jgi:hypothetical protein
MSLSTDLYLSGILGKYAVGPSHVPLVRQILSPHIIKWSAGFLVSMDVSGSLAKGTAVSSGTDTDFFISLSSTTPGSLQNIYDTLFNKLSQVGLSPTKQNVSIGVQLVGHKVDLVPGRRQGHQGNDHSLYVSKRNTWAQTNVVTHINLVAGSGRTDEIKLTKIWRNQRNLEFPSFYLELAVIDALTSCRRGQISDNFWEVLRFLSLSFAGKVYDDPANSNNRISDDITSRQRQLIAAAATQSRQQGNWENIVW